MTIQQGFAIRRNGSCLAGLETDCGKQAKNFRGCCPTGFVCPEAYNVDCCPSGKNCTTEIVSKPVCANSTWDLYERGGYFCCEPGLPGYDRNDTSICAEPGSTHNGRFLSLVTAGDSATPTSSTNGSSTPVGAIAGGVVGGLAGLALLALVAWFILRRKRQITGEEPYLLGHNANGNGHGGTYTAHQLDDGQRVNEAGVGKITCTHSEELPAESVPVELPAAQRLV